MDRCGQIAADDPQVRQAPRSVHFDDNRLWVHLADGRVIAAPLAWFPRLLYASPAQRACFELSPRGIHWDGLDEDIAIDGLLAGQGDLTRGRVTSPVG